MVSSELPPRIAVPAPGAAPLLDRADFQALSEAAAAWGRWEFMLTIAPLPIPNGTGSPVNPIAMF